MMDILSSILSGPFVHIERRIAPVGAGTASCVWCGGMPVVFGVVRGVPVPACAEHVEELVHMAGAPHEDINQGE